MALSDELISAFVEVTNDKTEIKQECTVYGTIVENGGNKYVQIDGSNLLTPVSSTAEANHGERVTVRIKDHTATVMGNASSPSARIGTVDDVSGRVGIIEADYAKFSVLEADYAKITTLEAEYAKIKTLEADYAKITTLEADYAKIKTLEADYAKIATLEANYAKISTLEADYARIDSLDSKYANIDFANIGEATMEKFYANSGLIKDATIKDGYITGNLVGVTIKGDLIEGNTIVAEKLVIKGDDGLYYRLNTDGTKVTSEQTDYNSLNGSIITAKSITADRINVSDLKAFGATIGGFHITDNTLYSGSKASVDNTTVGIFLGKDGQFAVGDATNYIKFYKASNGANKLDIAAESMTLAINTANNAATKADAAANAANAASTAAGNAATKADTATTTANAASTAAGNAANKADAATTAANNAATAAANAAKTATNYIQATTGGFIVGNMTAGTLGNNVLIDTDSVDIRNGNTVLASYGANTVYLGKNGRDTVIDLNNGGAQIFHKSDNEYGSKCIIETDYELQMHSMYRTYISNTWDNSVMMGTATLEMHSHDFGTGAATPRGRVHISAVDQELTGNKYLRESYVDLTSDMAAIWAVGQNDVGAAAESIFWAWSDGCCHMYGTTRTSLGFEASATKVYGDNVTISGCDISYNVRKNVSDSGVTYKPYFEAGDSITFSWHGAGYITSGGEIVYFTIPLAKPAIGSPTVTISSADGFKIRQNGKYLYGAAATTYMWPTSLTATLAASGNFIRVAATMPSDSNAVNNDACGVDINVKLTFS